MDVYKVSTANNDTALNIRGEGTVTLKLNNANSNIFFLKLYKVAFTLSAKTNFISLSKLADTSMRSV